MNNPRYDLVTISAIMLAGILTVWLGIWGPLSWPALKEWQTLMSAIIAPSLALIPATIAYKAAMKNVNFQRSEAERRRESERLALFIRLQHAADKMATEATRASLKIKLVQHAPIEITISKRDLVLHDQIELDEAWRCANLLPAPILGNVAAWRTLVQELMHRLDDYDSKHHWTFNLPDMSAFAYIDAAPQFLQVYVLEAENIAFHCTIISQALRPAIEAMHRRYG